MQGLLICSEAIARATAPVWGECLFVTILAIASSYIGYFCDHSYCYYLHTGDAAYVAANYRTFLPMFLMGGMLFTVLVIYIILFRKLKPVGTNRQYYINLN